MSSEFDIIFAGGGTTACVVAGRLIAANPSLKILIVERGQHSHDLPIHVQPCRFVENRAPASTTVSFHTAKPNEHLNGRALVIPSGKCVGGGSAVNFMVYTRGAASDYDDWAKLGNEGWGFAELLPLIKKVETYHPQTDHPMHGYVGPIQVSAGQVDLGIKKQFLDVGKAYDPHRPQVDDCNDFKTANAYGPWYKYIDPKTGRCSDAASAYLYSHLQNLDLEIQVGMCVKHIIIENGHAVGIEYTTDTLSPGAVANVITVAASKLVVVSGGAFGSPTILERSGIGNPYVLNKNNVSVIVDLPGVGQNYQDHIGAFPVFHALDDANTMDDVWSNPGEISEKLQEWKTNGTGKVAHNGFEAFMKFHPTTSELASIGPAFQSMWESFFQHSTDKPVAIMAPIPGYLGYYSALPPSGQKFLTMEYYLMYPRSSGSVHITSKDDVNAPLAFDPCFFSKAGDIECLTMLYKKAREIARCMPIYRGEATFCQPLFETSSLAACQKQDGPVPIEAPDLVYSIEDNKAIENFHCNTGGLSLVITLGTCAMKPYEQGGVVDSRLNVYGVKNLKVADLSICPSNIGNNTYSTALLIREKAAVIIAQDLKISID